MMETSHTGVAAKPSKRVRGDVATISLQHKIVALLLSSSARKYLNKPEKIDARQVMVAYGPITRQRLRNKQRDNGHC
jgi:hypothetical protein